MSYTLDAKTVALYDLGTDGTNIAGDADWDLTANGDGTFRRTPTFAQMVRFASSWTIEREVTITSATAGTVLELGGWGETEAVNIQLVIGWGADLKLFAAWERGAGIDQVYTASSPLPLNAPLRVAVTRNAGTLSILVNGALLAEWGAVVGPTGGGSPTPGMTLAVGYRVSSSDPQKYSGGGWLRVSQPRGHDEIRQEWELHYSAPVPTGLTWDELARREDARAVYIFRGSYVSGAQVAWATRHVHTGSGLVEGRLLSAPGSIVMGMPETPGAPPERTSASLVIDNADGALTEHFAGGFDPAEEYEGDSLLSLSGKLFLGYVGPDGVLVEQAITPTLVAIGTPVSTGTEIQVQMATDDALILGPTRKLVTVERVRDADWLANGQRWSSLGEPRGAFSNVALTALQGRITESLDAIVPFAFGRAPIRLTEVAAGRHLAFLSLSEPDLSGAADWVLYSGSARKRVVSLLGVTWDLWSVKIQVKRDDGTTQQVWLVGADVPLSQMAAAVGEDDPYGDEDLFLLPPTSVGMASGVSASPARVIQQILTDLSETGAAAVHTTSFDLAAMDVPPVDVCGGVVRTNTALSEVLTHIAGAWGLALWIDTDDKVHVARPTGWSVGDAAVAEGALPHVRPADVVQGSFSERIASPSEHGGPNKRVSIDWSSEQVEFWPAHERPTTAPGRTTLALAGEPEARVSGAWVFPPSSDVALRGTASRRAFAHRRISIALPSWAMAWPLGSLVRLTHPFGAASLGHQGRLLRVFRREHMPGEDSCRVELIDMEAYLHLRAGKLDSAINWIFYDPEGNGVALIFEQGSEMVTLTDPIADPEWEGRSLWTFGASEPLLRRSWRITAVPSSTTLRLREVAPEDGVMSASAPAAPHRAEWIVMRNRTSDPEHRPEYITVADEETSEHTDGSPAYRFTA